MSVIGVTGHRTFLHSSQAITHVARALLTELGATEVITGMALGFDQLVAELCVEMGIPFIAAIPCKDQEKLWSPVQQERYHELLNKAARVVMVDDGEYAPWKMQKRNQWIVDHSERMVSYWNGSKEGGTANCLRYAKHVKRQVEFIKFPKNHPLLKSLYT